jgi:hypothetical protein
MRQTLVATALLISVVFAPTPGWAAEAPPTPPAYIATFEGGHIDLRQGWGDAKACTTDLQDTECFRSERELDQYLDGQGGGSTRQTVSQALGDPSPQVTCGSNIRLYSSTFFSGSVLAISTRAALVNLATWSFSNLVSSYQIGSCNSTFYDGANAGYPIYPGGTLAGASASVMVSGWDNRISSIYIN